MCIVLGCAMGNILDSIPCSRLDNIPDSMLGSILGNHLDSMLGRIMCSNLSNILGHIPGHTLRNLLGTVRGGRLDQTQGSHRDPSLDTLSCNSDMYFHPIYAQHRSPCTPHHTTRTAGVTHTHATAHRSPPTTEPTARTPSMQRMPHPSVLPRHTPRHTHTYTLQTHPIPPYHKHHTAPRHLTPHVNRTHHYHQAFSNSSALPATHLSPYQVYFLSIRWFVLGLVLSRPVYTPVDIFSLSGPFLCHHARTRTVVCFISGPSLGIPRARWVMFAICLVRLRHS